MITLNSSNCCEAPDQVGPPISYMEELGVFRMPVSTNNPMGLCQFYRTSPEKANVLMGLKSAECACTIHSLIEIAQENRVAAHGCGLRRGVHLSLVSARQITLVVGFIVI